MPLRAPETPRASTEGIRRSLVTGAVAEGWARRAGAARLVTAARAKGGADSRPSTAATDARRSLGDAAPSERHENGLCVAAKGRFIMFIRENESCAAPAIMRHISFCCNGGAATPLYNDCGRQCCHGGDETRRHIRALLTFPRGATHGEARNVERKTSRGNVERKRREEMSGGNVGRYLCRGRASSRQSAPWRTFRLEGR